MKAAEVLALIRAHVNGDHERFRGVALAMAANVESSAPKVAKQIRDAVDKLKTHGAAVMTRLPDGVTDLIERELLPPRTSLADMVLDVSVREGLERVVLEHENRARLAEHGLGPMRKLLFVGPPGVGKTMAASALAHELNFTLGRIQLHAVLTSFLGETSKKLGAVFQAIRSWTGVYLFDEFDALASDRGRDDVGEMRRVVNSMLQFIEQDDSDSIMIAATNYGAIIDTAMFRRFDMIIRFPLASAGDARDLVSNELLWSDRIAWPAVMKVGENMSHADIVAACKQVNKDAVLAGHEHIETDELVTALSDRCRTVTPDGDRDGKEDTATAAPGDDDEGSRGHRGSARAPVEDAGVQLRD